MLALSPIPYAPTPPAYSSASTTSASASASASASTSALPHYYLCSGGSDGRVVVWNVSAALQCAGAEALERGLPHHLQYQRNASDHRQQQIKLVSVLANFKGKAFGLFFLFF